MSEPSKKHYVGKACFTAAVDFEFDAVDEDEARLLADAAAWDVNIEQISDSLQLDNVDWELDYGEEDK